MGCSWMYESDSMFRCLIILIDLLKRANYIKLGSLYIRNFSHFQPLFASIIHPFVNLFSEQHLYVALITFV